MAARDSSKTIVAAGMLRMNWLRRTRNGGIGLASMRRGPIANSPEILTQLLPVLETRARAVGALGLSLNPSVLGADIEAWLAPLRAQGYTRISADLQNLPTATALIDLQPPEDDILMSFDKHCRNKIRKSARKNMHTRPVASEEEAARLSQIMVDMADSTAMEIDSQHRFEPHYAFLTQNPDCGTLLAVEWDGRLIGGSVNYLEGKIGYNLISATAPDVREVPRAHLLMWDVMRDLKSKGATRFDMVGFADPDFEDSAEAVGRYAFKSSFEPEIEHVLPIMSKPLKPAAFFAAQTLRRFYRNSKYKNALKSLWNKRS